MNSQWKIALGMIFIIGVAFFLINRLGSEPERNWSWYENYNMGSEEPYGTMVLREMMDSYTGGEVEIVSGDLEEFDWEGAFGNWFFVGPRMGFPSKDVEKLIAFIERGNTAFLAAEGLADTLLWSFGFDRHCTLGYFYYYDDSDKSDDRASFRSDTIATRIPLNFVEAYRHLPEDHQLQHSDGSGLDPYHFILFDTSSLAECLSEMEVLGYSGATANLIRIRLGEGEVYLYSTPLALTNYHLVQSDGKDYAERLLSSLDTGNIYWDTGNHLDWTPPLDDPSESALRFILGQQALRWAWYVILLAGLFYLIFRTRRRQAPIALVDPKENSTLEYLHTISRLHFRQGAGHGEIAGLLRQQYYSFIRERYHLSTAHKDERFVQALAMRSGLPDQQIGELQQRMNDLDKESEVNDYVLLRLYNHLRTFYDNCK
jgi:hypothetical protein